MDFIQANLIAPINGKLWSYVLDVLILGGIYFTIRTKFVQIRLFPRMWGIIGSSRKNAEGGISSFQAFAIGLSSRVGTGNITGVAIALTAGGPGAIFWMWVVALIGMATAFVEATLAQIFKVRSPDGSFRGGPAYYIKKGLGSKPGGIVFAVLLIFTVGIAFNMVQSNTIAGALEGDGNLKLNIHYTALVLMVLCAPVLFGGIRRIAKVAEVILPIMAVSYILLAIVMICTNIGDVGHILWQIFGSAFGIKSALGGFAGGIANALLNGAKRGLFSNEAGMGTAPNTAATATTSHPANQGLIQSLGVFVDTMLICTATAFMILIAGKDVYDPGKLDGVKGATLTRAAVEHQFGAWSGWLMLALIIVFAFSSVLGNYAYAEVNLDFLGANAMVMNAFRVIVILSVGFGSIVALTAVWDFADVCSGAMALMNIVVIVLLGKWAFSALRDWERQRKEGRDPTYCVDAGLLADAPARLRNDFQNESAWPLPEGSGSIPRR